METFHILVEIVPNYCGGWRCNYTGWKRHRGRDRKLLVSAVAVDSGLTFMGHELQLTCLWLALMYVSVADAATFSSSGHIAPLGSLSRQPQCSSEPQTSYAIVQKVGNSARIPTFCAFSFWWGRFHRGKLCHWGVKWPMQQTHFYDSRCPFQCIYLFCSLLIDTIAGCAFFFSQAHWDALAWSKKQMLKKNRYKCILSLHLLSTRNMIFCLFWTVVKPECYKEVVSSWTLTHFIHNS